jgi:hypothetical protein
METIQEYDEHKKTDSELEIKDVSENDFVDIANGIDICCICLENMDNKNIYQYNNCLHKIHNECHRTLIFNKKDFCPLCRTKEHIKEQIQETVTQGPNQEIVINININSIVPENIIIIRTRNRNSKRYYSCMLILLFFIMMTVILILI